MILAPGNRYTEAQRERTLCHSALRQPSPDEERHHLLCQCKNLMKNNGNPDFNNDDTTSDESSFCSVEFQSREKKHERRECGTKCFPSTSPDTRTRTRINSANKHISDAKAQFHRLSAALENAGVSSRMDFDNCKECDNPNNTIHPNETSPTSTLNFPDEHVPPAFCTTHQSAVMNQSIFCNETTVLTTASNPCEIQMHKPSHTFVVCADSQIGMTSQNKEWETELNYCREAISKMNQLSPKPAFVCVCGDLIDMEYTFFANETTGLTKEQCDKIQDDQNAAFKEVWSTLDDDIPLVCLCGNHDIGNVPTRTSIEKFKSAFGDEYLAFWSNGSYNIVMNNVLFSEPSGAMDMFEEHLTWLEERLEYGVSHQANHIFVFGHHPWFLYNDDEVEEDLKGVIPFPEEWGSRDGAGFPERYFGIRKKYRDMALSLFKKYGVSACFSGHFHQNVVSKSSFGMDMIITGPLSLVFDSDNKPESYEENVRGIRIVEVTKGHFSHRFETL